MKTYICKEQFEIPLVDDNDFEIEDKFMLVEKDSIWYFLEDYGLSDLMLENDDGACLDITKKTLENYFIEL